MARKGSVTDFDVAVEGIGNFKFARRTMRDEIRIQVEYARIIEGVEPTAWLATIGGWLSALSVLTVSSPDGWDLDSFDPLDPETYANLLKVHSALVERERSFRSQSGKNSETNGAPTVSNNRVLVSPQVQSDSE